jgi:non-specific protein-tyrosine kinase
MELREFAAVIRKWLWLIILSTAVAGVFSWFAVKDRPPLYQTSTTLIIGPAMGAANPQFLDLQISEQLAMTYSEVIRLEPILRATARALGIEEQWTMLRGQIGVSLVPGTQLIKITVTDTNPQRAKLIADETARQLMAEVEKARPQDSNRQFIEEQAASLPTMIQAAQEEIQQLEAGLGDAFSAREIQDIQGQINTLQNQVNSWRATFAQYQLLLGDTGANVLRVLEEAPLPTYPIASRQMMQVLMAAAVGMILALGAVFAVEYLDDTLKSPEDAARASGLTAIGAITRISGEAPSEKLVTILHPKSPISEAYRVMRTNLQFSSVDKPFKTLVVTSPSPVEGKSTTLANLGVVMAEAGQSVILVDTDLRRPMLHKIFQLQNKEGLTGILVRPGLEMDGHLQETGIDNLRVLTSGPLPPNPAELLSSKKMRYLIQQLQQRADIVVFDTPPALPIADAALLATQTDGVLVVAEAGKTRKTAVQQVVERLQNVGANLLGVALNRISPRWRGGGYYYYYYYYHYSEKGKGRGRRKRRWYERLPLVDRLLNRPR